jgi:hypothetical protein
MDESNLSTETFNIGGKKQKKNKGNFFKSWRSHGKTMEDLEALERKSEKNLKRRQTRT